MRNREKDLRNKETSLAFSPGQIKSIDAFYQQIKDQGVRFNSPPLVVREGVKAAYFHDPDGITLELIEYGIP